MKNPFKRYSRQYVEKEIKAMERQIEYMEEMVNSMKCKIRDLKKGCGLLGK